MVMARIGPCQGICRLGRILEMLSLSLHQLANGTANKTAMYLRLGLNGIQKMWTY
jgi:hypothetical protein